MEELALVSELAEVESTIETLDINELPDDTWRKENVIELPDDSWIKETCTDLPDDTWNRNEKISECRMIETIVVEFKYPENCDINEFDRQLKGQEDGMNKLTISEYLNNRENYRLNGRSIEGMDAQKEFREKTLADRIASNREKGMDYNTAKIEALEWIQDKAALHEPDQIAGGDPLKVSDIGDSAINSSIGSQWRNKINTVDIQIQNYAQKLSPEAQNKTLLNIKLKGVS